MGCLCGVFFTGHVRDIWVFAPIMVAEGNRTYHRPRPASRLPLDLVIEFIITLLLGTVGFSVDANSALVLAKSPTGPFGLQVGLQMGSFFDRSRS